MKPDSVLVDISIDQGGCFEDSRLTTHANPTYTVHDSIFYCVANMPGAVPHTSTYALTNVTLPYAVALANEGWRQTMRDDPSLALGLNSHDGHITYAPVAEAHGRECVFVDDVLPYPSQDSSSSKSTSVRTANPVPPLGVEPLGSPVLYAGPAMSTCA